LESRGI